MQAPCRTSRPFMQGLLDLLVTISSTISGQSCRPWFRLQFRHVEVVNCGH